MYLLYFCIFSPQFLRFNTMDFKIASVDSANQHNQVRVKWQPLWVNSDSIPQNLRAEVDVLCRRGERTLVQWRPTYHKISYLRTHYSNDLTLSQLSYLDTLEGFHCFDHPTKDFINQRVRSLAIDSGPNSLCVYLDADYAKTTKYLHKLDVRCIAVNDDPKVIRQIVLQPQAQNICIFNGKLHEYLVYMATDDSIDFIWADYCSSFFRREHGPENDIKQLKRKLKKRTGRAAFTFSLRSGKRHHKNQIAHIKQFIENTLNLHNTYQLVYNRNMLYLEFASAKHQYNLRKRS